MKNLFLLTLKPLHIHFFILRNVPRVTGDACSFERPVLCEQTLKHMKR